MVKKARNPKYWSNSNMILRFMFQRYFENDTFSKSNLKKYLIGIEVQKIGQTPKFVIQNN